MSDLVQQLRAFVELDGGDLAVVERAADELDRLTRELEEARKDAERYRWLRDVAWNDGTLCYFDMRYGNEEWDDKIDAAMSQEKRKDALDRMARDADELGLDF